MVDLEHRTDAVAVDGLVGVADGRQQGVDIGGLDDGAHRIRLVAHVVVVEGVDSLGDLAGHAVFDHRGDAEECDDGHGYCFEPDASNSADRN